MPSFYTNATGSSDNWDAIVSVGPRVTSALVGRYHVRREVIREIPYGVEVPDGYPRDEGSHTTAPTARSAPLLEGQAPSWPPADLPEAMAHDWQTPLKAVYVGRLEDKQKGVLRLPSILKQAAKTTAISLDIIGDGPDREALERAFIETGNRSAARFHGLLNKDHTLAVLKEQDVLILPSNFEGYPIVVLEAMAAGVVPVVSRLPDITDKQITEGVDGFLVEPTDIQTFASHLTKLGSDREKLQTMSKAAWNNARHRSTVEAMCRQYLNLIQELQDTRRQSGKPRSGKIAIELLGDLPDLPLCLVRPVRKILRTLGLWPASKAA